MSVVELPIDHDEWQRIRDVSLAAGIDDFLYARPVHTVVDFEREPRLDQVEGHGRTHDPQADKADLRAAGLGWHRLRFPSVRKSRTCVDDPGCRRC